MLNIKNKFPIYMSNIYIYKDVCVCEYIIRDS